MKQNSSFILLFVALSLTTPSLGLATSRVSARAPQRTKQTRHHRKAHRNLADEAKISESVARATALAKIPNGSVKAFELEREHGTLIYSYEIVVPGKSGIEEVNINAIDGTIVAVEHEGPKAEIKEAKSEHHAGGTPTHH